jgi:uncharacterized RDD family membrane protein YckC
MATTVNYAPIWKRFFAFMIDLLILSAIGFAIGIFAGYNPIAEFQESMKKILEDPKTQPTPLSIPAVVSFSKLILDWLYYSLFESSVLQGTPGKWFLNIKVTNLNGDRIDFGKATIRYSISLLSSVVSLAPGLRNIFFIFFIDQILAFFNQKRQSLHDILAQTLVLDR